MTGTDPLTDYRLADNQEFYMFPIISKDHIFSRKIKCVGCSKELETLFHIGCVWQDRKRMYMHNHAVSHLDRVWNCSRCCFQGKTKPAIKKHAHLMHASEKSSVYAILSMSSEDYAALIEKTIEECFPGVIYPKKRA